MPQLGHFNSAAHDHVIVFRLSGEFDMSNAWKVRDALLDAIRHEHRDIAVDLEGVRFMDAQLVRVLITARTAAASRDLGFAVIPPADATVSRVARLMDMEEAA